ncbi:glutathione S-transferase C-terminal domain-containing protein isoform X1 [Electrophorus electricus]|nr:glutathione S-transferase C-terminal domain-containing protein isoform X1 [Electrophorus electricus]
MTHPEPSPGAARLFLEVSTVHGAPSLPLHSAISLFLLSYTECTSVHVHLVWTRAGSARALSGALPRSLPVSELKREDAPPLVRSCRLPAVLEADGRFCRAGLAVVLRCIIQRSCLERHGRRDVASLLGFKGTCLKACAEVSQWTRLCEMDIPSAVEEHLLSPTEEGLQVPAAILHLEHCLAEPVRVHNDDKLRRNKLRQQRNARSVQPGAPGEGGQQVCPTEPQGEDPRAEPRLAQPSEGVELSAALAKLSVDAVPAAATRECSDIRRVKTAELPDLEHVFAEGLYFTLTDVVLLPCVYRYLSSLAQHAPHTLDRLPLLLRWYARVRELPAIVRAAHDCGMSLSSPQRSRTFSPAPGTPWPGDAQQESPRPSEEHFVGGPRPTLTKLQENGIDAVFSPHPCPSWSLHWETLPSAVSPTEGKMSASRAVRKQQQLNNLVAMVMELARPGHTIVDFCSGGGHLGIVLAHTLPKCQVILVENKEESLARARERSSQLSLPNVSFIQANLDYFTGPFHVGVALHACGVATDMVVDRCVQARAGFVVSPCCYGFIQNTLKFNFPRSKKFAETVTCKEHMILCRFADQTAVQLPAERRSIGKRCMGLVDLDRGWAAEAHGYSVRVMTMEPESCSPKNNMLVGILAEKDTAGH